MIIVSDEEFGLLVQLSIDKLSETIEEAKNVVIVVEDDPTPEQRVRLHLHNNQTLFGLYEGVPLAARNGNINSYLPDKITIFKNPICASVNTVRDLQEQIHNTVWHEFAHHFGLNHNQIQNLE